MTCSHHCQFSYLESIVEALGGVLKYVESSKTINSLSLWRYMGEQEGCYKKAATLDNMCLGCILGITKMHWSHILPVLKWGKSLEALENVGTKYDVFNLVVIIQALHPCSHYHSIVRHTRDSGTSVLQYSKTRHECSAIWGRWQCRSHIQNSQSTLRGPEDDELSTYRTLPYPYRTLKLMLDSHYTHWGYPLKSEVYLFSWSILTILRSEPCITMTK